jgi:hypothetical protein
MSTQYLEEAAVVAGFQLGYECMDSSWMMVCERAVLPVYACMHLQV